MANNAEFFVKGARQIADMGYEEVNLNAGCPGNLLYTCMISSNSEASIIPIRVLTDIFISSLQNTSSKNFSIKYVSLLLQNFLEDRINILHHLFLRVIILN